MPPPLQVQQALLNLGHLSTSDSTPCSSDTSGSSPHPISPLIASYASSSRGPGLGLGPDPQAYSHIRHSSSPLYQSESQLHPPPSVPSTFLPSYYPEGRYNSALPSSLTPRFDDPTSSSSPVMSIHSPLNWERQSQAGPSTRHLLDGVPLRSPPRLKRPLGPPSYEITPESIASSLPSGSSRRIHGLSRVATAGQPQALYPDDTEGSSGAHYRSSHVASGRGGLVTSSSPSVSASAGAGMGYPNGHDATGNQQSISSSYLETTYGNIPLATRLTLDSPQDGMDPQISGEQYAHALDLYSHLLEAIPSFRSTSDHFPPGQRYDSLLHLASDGARLLAGENEPSVGLVPPHGDGQGPGPGPNNGMMHDRANHFPLHAHHQQPGTAYVAGMEDRRIVDIDGPPAKRQALAAAHGHAHGEKKTTKCLGCGATETPEWRRGPMGPRTLCNACGLVHMKLQRKKKKQEEKAAALAREKAGA